MANSIALWVALCSYTFFGICDCTTLDPCQRQPFKATCVSQDQNRITGGRSQFVLRFYRRGDECVSYPFALCRGDQAHATLFKRKEDCEQACLPPASKQLVILSKTKVTAPSSTKKATSAQIFASMMTTAQTDPISETRTTAPMEAMTKCQQQKMLAERTVPQGTSHPPLVVYRCTADGAFEQVQCHEVSNACWCVDQNGHEIANTRTQSVNVPPNCKPFQNSDVLSSTPESSQKARTMKTFHCESGSPATDERSRPISCFQQSCPQGYKCVVHESDAVCCPDGEEKKLASNLITPNDACALPKDRGTCNKFELRFYFNDESKECKYFFYGGCGGNANNFKDLAECEKACGKSIGQKMADFKAAPTVAAHQSPTYDRCADAKDAGPCAGRFIRWFWNATAARCDLFVYGGCKGTGNNFATKEVCQETCAGARAKHRHPTVGQAKATTTTAPQLRKAPSEMPRPSTTAKITVPTSLGGNSQKTATTDAKKSDASRSCRNEECAADCIEITNGHGCSECMCPQGTSSDRGAASKEPISKKPLKGNGTQPMLTTAVPMKGSQPNADVDKCLLPLDVGPCEGPVQARWGYSTTTKRCERFDYTGCGGNMNHFYSLRECNILCAKHTLHQFDIAQPVAENEVQSINVTNSTHARNSGTLASIQEDVDPICSLPRDAGPCINHVTKWFYNAVTGRCESFNYGSCGGNSNNFDTEEVCKARCVSGAQSMGVSVPDVCAQDKDSGPCQGYNVRYYYNPRNMRCELFVYGGCGGNSNNFNSKEACDLTCPVYEKIWNSSGPKFVSTKATPPSGSASAMDVTKKTEVAAKSPEHGVIMRDDIGQASVNSTEVPVQEFSGAQPPATVPVNMDGGMSEDQAAFLGYNEAQMEMQPIEGGEQAPLCPNGLPAKTGPNGQITLCLPGKSQCPPNSSCYYNGMDFFCCPIEEISALPLVVEDRNMVMGENSAEGYRVRSRRQNPYMGSPEYTAPSMLPNLPLESPLKAPALRGPYGGLGVQTNRRPQTVNAIFGPTSQYDYSIPQPPTLTSTSALRPQYCDLPVNQGPCKGSHLRYYYNLSIDECRLFYYGGCQGNRNNFATIELCRKECVKKPKNLSCPSGLPPLGGISSPIICGPSAGGIECPQGFTCSSGLFSVCCPDQGSMDDLPKGAPDALPNSPRLMPPSFSIHGNRGVEQHQQYGQAVEKQSPLVQLPPGQSMGYADSSAQDESEDAHNQDELYGTMEQHSDAGNMNAAEQLSAVAADMPAEKPQARPQERAQLTANELCFLPADSGRPCVGENNKQSPNSVFYYYHAESEQCIHLDYKGCGGNKNRFSSRNDCYRVCHRDLAPVAP